MIKRVLYLFIGLNIVLSGYYVVKFERERELIRRIENKLNLTNNKLENIKKITNWIYSNSKAKNQKYKCPAWNLNCWKHYNPLWKILKAPPEIIIKQGGHCGNMTRLAINMFEVTNINAQRWHLWYPKQKVQQYDKEHNLTNSDQYGHAVVEVFLKNKKIVVDPTFDVVYPYSMKELNKNPNLIWKYVPKNYDKFYTYEEARGIRWEIIGGKEDKIYKFLVNIFDKKTVNNLHYPYLLDRPYLFLAIFHFFLGLIFIALLFIIQNRRKSKICVE